MNKLSNLISSKKYNKLAQDLPDEFKDRDELDVLANMEREQKSAESTTISGKQYDKYGFETIEFFTDYGTQRVTIDGDISSEKPIIMTYHDIGINHNACYLSFFNMIKEYDVKFKYFTIIHIDAPQHHYNDDETLHGPPTIFNDTNIDSFDLLELCTQIEEIRSKLRIDKFIGFGIGSSTNIWTYYAMNYSHRLRGLILINGVSSGASWREWIFDKLLSGIGSNSQFLTDSLISSLLTRYFPRTVSKETYDYFLDEFDKIDTQSVIKYFRGFVRRKEFNEKQLSKIKTKTLIICGEYSRVKDETIKFQKNMPRRYTTFVLMNKGGFLLTESHPQKLCSSIDLFIQSLGLTKISLQAKFGKIKEEKDGEHSIADL